MPIYSYQAPDGRIVDLEGDSPASEQELEQVFSSLPAKTPVPRETISPEQQSINQFIASQQASPLSKLASGLGGALNSFIVEPVKGLAGTVTGVVGELAANPPQSLEELITTGVFPLRNQGARNVAQSTLEAAGRGVVDIGAGLRGLIQQGAARVADDPLGAAIGGLIPSVNVARQLESRTPSEGEIAQFIANQNLSNQLNVVKSQPIVPEVIGDVNVPLAEDIEIGAAAIPLVGPTLRGARALGGAIASPIRTGQALLERIAPTIGARTAPATVEQSAMAALDFTPAQVQQHIPVVTQRVSELVGKIPKTADEAISFINKAEDQLYADRLDFNSAATKQGLVVKGDVALQEARSTLDSIPTITEAQKSSIMDDLTDIYKGDHLPDKGQSFQQRLNKEFSAQYENGTWDKAAPVNEAKIAIRNSFANQMDEISQAITGRADTPYADIGSLIEFKGSLSDKLIKLKQTEAARKTGIEKAPGRIPTTKVGAVTKVGRSALTPFQKTQIEKLNQNVERIFTESAKQPPVLPLEQSIIDALKKAQSPSAGAASISEEAQIEALIKTYPRALRSDPSLARLAAESQLGIRPNVAP